jgi:P27 family predicted phage terminase small subunit
MPIDMPPIGAAFWDKHAETLIADGRLTQREDDAFSLLCYIMSDISMLRKEIERDGFTVEGARGNPVRNPCIQIQKDKEQQAVKLMLEFGLTPASRGRVPIGDPEEGYEDLD